MLIPKVTHVDTPGNPFTAHVICQGPCNPAMTRSSIMRAGCSAAGAWTAASHAQGSLSSVLQGARAPRPASGLTNLSGSWVGRRIVGGAPRHMQRP